MPEHADYVEVLRLHRKYAESPSEPLWKVFVRLGQRLEQDEIDGMTINEIADAVDHEALDKNRLAIEENKRARSLMGDLGVSRS